MFTDDQPAELSRRSSPSSGAPFNWKALPVDLLIQYRDEITAHLPPLALKDINLEEELLLQFHAIRQLQTTVLNDETLPLNQRAQVANSVTNILNKLTELQGEAYNQERFKAIELALIRSLRTLPEDVAKDFIEQYEEVVKKHTTTKVVE